MKKHKTKLLILLTAVLIAAFNSGCQNNAAKIATSNRDWPAFLAGTWKTDSKVQGSDWTITFDAQGKIVSMKHSFVEIPFNVADGGVVVPMAQEKESTYVLGPCYATYNTDTRTLHVHIVLEFLSIELPFATIEGNMTDHFAGTVDTTRLTWQANRINMANIADFSSPDRPNISRSKLLFRKTDK